MTTNVTNHMLRKKLHEVQLQARTGVRGISSPSNVQESASEEYPPVSMMEKEITHVKGDKLVCSDGTTCKLLMPLPGLSWSCTAVTAPDGRQELEASLTGLVIGNGVENYCLGLWGDTREFEIILSSGDSELRLNNLFLSMKSETLIRNGLEVKDE